MRDLPSIAAWSVMSFHNLGTGRAPSFWQVFHAGESIGTNRAGRPMITIGERVARFSVRPGCLIAPGAPRYATEYVVRGADGHDYQYVAGATDASLARSLPVGSHIQKKWGQLGYEVNGQWQNFPIYFYSATFGAAFFAISWAALLQWRSKE